MVDLKHKPASSVIQVHEDVEGKTLSWKPAVGDQFAGVTWIGVLTCILFGWGVFEIFQIAVLTNSLPEESFQLDTIPTAARYILIGWFGLWTILGLWLLRIFYRSIAYPKVESITLSAFTMQFKPSPLIAGIRSWDVLWNRVLSPKIRTVELARTDAGPFVLDRVGERQRLYFDVGHERFEVGATLNEPDREWLAQVLQNWKQG